MRFNVYHILSPILLWIGLFCFLNQGLGQNDTLKVGFWQDAPTKNKMRYTTLVYGGGSAVVLTFVGLDQLWYAKHSRVPFHWFDDSREWYGMDKVGHGITSYYSVYLTSEAFQWSGLEKRKSNLIGLGAGFCFMSFIEVLDGFSEAWGASAGDFAANFAGAGLYFGQEWLLKKQAIVPKFSFTPSSYRSVRPSILGTSDFNSILKDYNGQTYWLSMNLCDLGLKGRFPKWLNLAVGYGANGMIGGKENPLLDAQGKPYPTFERYSQWYLSLDLDLRKIKTRYPFVRRVLDVVNLVKIPFPALEYSRGKFQFQPLQF